MWRIGFVLLGLAGMALACVEPALAQVTVNQGALQQLGGVQPPPVRPSLRRPLHHRYVRRRYGRPSPSYYAPLHHLPLPPPYVPKPTLPVTPVLVAPAPVIAAKPPPPPPPPPPPKVVPRVLTMIFPGATPDLPPGAAQELGQLVASPVIRSAHFIVAATAPGITGDPSVARRLSLNRALAVRAKLRAAGVPSEHIIVQALGSPPKQPDDRVTLTQTP